MSDAKIVVIEPTNNCNLRCSKCLHGNGIFPRKKGYLSEENLRIILNKLPNTIEFIGLGGIGENFLHPNFFNLIDICKSYKEEILIGFHSNGTLLNEEIINEIIKRDINDISFSIDSSTNDTYKMIHNCVFDLDKVLSSIRELINKKNFYNLNLKINVSYVIQKENIGELGDFIKLASNLDADNIGPINIVTPMHGYSFENWKDSQDELKREIFYAQSIALKYNIAVNFPNIYEQKAGSANVDIMDKVSCAFPFSLYPIITWDGFVFPCVWLHDTEKSSIGNIIQNDSFDDIWKGKKINRIREIFLNGNYLKECSNCKPGNLNYKSMNFEEIF